MKSKEKIVLVILTIIACYLLATSRFDISTLFFPAPLRSLIFTSPE